MKTININGKDFTLEELSTLIENSKRDNPMLEVYKFNNTTEEEFDKLYQNIPAHIKAYAQEEMIVNFYNKGEKVNFSNHNQSKYYVWFYLGDNFRFYDVCYQYSCAGSSSRLGFLRKEDALEAKDKFFEIYRLSRNS